MTMVPPGEFEAATYKVLYPELSGFDDLNLREHYFHHGITEGRVPNSIANRVDFANLVEEHYEVLEIGPWAAPLVRGSNVRYADTLGTEQLRERAHQHGMDPDGVPRIDWVIPPNDLSPITEKFDCVVSSHLVEHQPDLVAHLKSVSRLLREGGRYFLVIPDHRYCFDRFFAPSNVAQVVAAHIEQRDVHSLESLIQHRALLAHNDAVRHWNGDHGRFPIGRANLISAALEEFRQAYGSYIDVHAWFFEPATWSLIMEDLVSLGLSDLELSRVYATRYGQFEFFSVLEKNCTAQS